MTPPKAPPAPPSASALPASAPTPAAALEVGVQLAEIVKDLKRIASAVPTPNVTDSQLHGQQLAEIAAKLEKLANA
jgi:hypothetical protein